MAYRSKISKIIYIPASHLSKLVNTYTRLQQLINNSKCELAIKKDCIKSNCVFVVYIDNDNFDKINIGISGYKIENYAEYIQGFLTISKRDNIKNVYNTGVDVTSLDEIFNLCTMNSYVTTALLQSVISEFNTEVFWIGIGLGGSDKQWNETLENVVKLGFLHPILTDTSPSGIKLDYKYMAFLLDAYQYKNRNPSEMKVKNTIEKALQLKYQILPSKMIERLISSKTSPKSPVNTLKYTNITGESTKLLEKVSPIKKEDLYTSSDKFNVINPPYNAPLERYERKDGTTNSIAKICLDGYNLTKYLAEGTYGVVFKTGCDIKGDCKYVIKIQILDDDEELIRGWEKEAMLVKLLSKKYNIGAGLIGAWRCGNETGLIVTELWDGDLQLDTQPNVNPSCITKKLINKLKTQIKTLHDIGYVHGDILPKNILVKKNNQGVVTDVTLSDFGSVNTPQGWRDEEVPGPESWIEIWYGYHLNHPFLEEYYEDNNITLKDVIKNPALLDFDLIYYFEKYC